MLGKFTVQIARAIDRYDIAHEFFLKHIEVLKKHNVKGITSIKPQWKYMPNVYVIAVYDNISDEMIGGMRLEVSSRSNLLPFESALSSEFSNVHSFVEHYRDNGGVCEFSGLWVNSTHNKQGIPEFMTKLGISLSRTLCIKYAFAFANNYSRPITERLGFISETVGGESVFLYPDERYPTQLMMKDCLTEELEYVSIDHQLKVRKAL